MGQVDCTFGGHHVDGDSGLDVTVALGPMPGVISLAVIGAEDSWAAGSLVLTDGVETITITNLTPFAWQVRSGPQGEYTEVQIRDSRQRWQTRGQITGEYNKPGPDGAPNDQEPLRNLVAFCLDALGEVGYDVSALPADYYPYVRWEAARPGVEASRLCDMAQCVLSLHSDGTARVYKLGTGQGIPAGYKEMNDVGTESRERPTAYLVRGAQTITQRTSVLVPVGLDTDGSIKPIADLSYYAQIIADFGSVAAGVQQYFAKWFETGNLTKGECARKSIWKWFRVSDAEALYLPALPSVCQVITDLAASPPRKRWRKPYLYSPDLAQVWDDARKQCFTIGDLDRREWELEEATGLVKLTDGPVIKPPEVDVAWDVAEVRLTWAHKDVAADGSLSLANFYSYCSVSPAPADATLEVIHIEWLQLRRIIQGGELPDIFLGREVLDPIAQQIIALADPGAATAVCAEVLYSGLKWVYPDGTVRQVTWHVGADGATTKIIYNTDRPPLGGARLDRMIEALKRQYEAKTGLAAADRGRLAGSALPETAPAARTDRRGPYGQAESECRLYFNADAEAIEEEGVMVMAGGNDLVHKVQNATWPRAAGVYEVAIARHPIPTGHPGHGWFTGQHVVKYRPRTDGHGPTIREGSLIGPVKNSCYASYDPSGCWRVLEILEPPGVTAPGRARVQFIRGGR